MVLNVGEFCERIDAGMRECYIEIYFIDSINILVFFSGKNPLGGNFDYEKRDAKK